MNPLRRLGGGMKQNHLRVAGWIGVLILPGYLAFASFSFDLSAFIRTMFPEERRRRDFRLN